ncbi:hypothetical protein L218DRAFT_986073 [Marasmius fiardii PR-910]|nr:hypothetical protein L218DRAFT_986073 [Marasmius fiardii PR-910]
MYGAVLNEDERVAIARTLRGSLYYTDCWGNDEEDLRWYYHYHVRMFSTPEKFADLVAMGRTIGDCDAKEPCNCLAMVKDHLGRSKPKAGAVKVIKMDGAKISGTTAKNLEEFEKILFGGRGWLSPLKLFCIIAYAGTVGHYHEALGSQLLKKAGLDKFISFKDEADGKTIVGDLLKAKGDPICVPQQLLLSAHDAGGNKETNAEEVVEGIEEETLE